MTDESWYAQTAYGLKEVPQQEPSSERPWIMRFAKVRLPWGNTDEVTAANLLEKFSPKKLRHYEGIKKEREEKIAAENHSSARHELIDFHIRDDHERFRYASLPASSHFWLYMKAFGKWFFYIIFIFSIPSHFVMTSATTEPFWELTKRSIFEYYSWFLGVPLLSWVIGPEFIE